jgi:hypothetical protein
MNFGIIGIDSVIVFGNNAKLVNAILVKFNYEFENNRKRFSYRI